jgi:hypothetical protein
MDLIAVQLDAVAAGEDVEDLAHACVCFRCKELLRRCPTTLDHDLELLRGDGPPLSEAMRLVLALRVAKKEVLGEYAQVWDRLQDAAA